MGRRGAAAALCILVAAACIAQDHDWTPHARAAEEPARKPNIVFILTDDLSSNLVPYMPNVLAMQQEGASFTSYFVTNSLCCPSRSSIFTGMFPHNTGVMTNKAPDGGYAVFNARGNEPLTFAIALQRGGYKTAMLGKYLNGYYPAMHRVPAGWDEWAVAGDAYPEFNYDLNQNGRVVRYGSRAEDYLTDVLAGMADAFIRKSAQGPFFIEIATFAPHGPFTPAPRDAASFPRLTAPRSAAFGARSGPDAASWLKGIPPLSPGDMQNIDRGFRMRVRAVQAIDRMIGQIRSTLSALGLDNTYVVFSSDNGLHMGEYSLRPGKMTPFDIDIRVPLVVVGPGVPKRHVVSAIAMNVDLFPTFTELGAASHGPASPDGRSLVPLLHGAAVTDWRRGALIEHLRSLPGSSDPDNQRPHAANPTTYAALRTDEALYVEYEGGEIGYYDLKQDPEELANVAANLPPAKLLRLRDILRANKECRGAQACWDAQRLVP
jgi:N-acetylglucosamine-6-sulfatase